MLYCVVLYCTVVTASSHLSILDSIEVVAVVSGEKHGDDATYILGHECRDNWGGVYCAEMICCCLYLL